MGTLAELKARIAAELNRSNLTTAIADEISRSIERYATRRFWFNQATGTTVTVSGQETATAPTGLRIADQAWVTIGGALREIDRRDLATITDWLGASSSNSGQPTDYAFSGSTLTFYRKPDAAYTVTVAGIYDLDALMDGDENAWTTEAEDLICYDVIERLRRIRIRDYPGAEAARIQKEEALNRLRGDTARRLQGRISG